MGLRKCIFSNNEYYHVYNRGVDKRIVFKNKVDFKRFLLLLEHCNTNKPIRRLKDIINIQQAQPFTSSKATGSLDLSLVKIHTFCLLPNHYHLILEQVAENGISTFMQKVGTGYSKYFNEKNKRSGSLFQGKFKATHVDSEPYLLQLYAYVSFNFLVHKQNNKTAYLSGNEYIFSKTHTHLFESNIKKIFSSLDQFTKFAIPKIRETIAKRNTNELHENTQ